MEEKHKEGKLRQLAHRLLGIKLGYRMFFIYIIGGFLPLILIGVYLIHGTNRLLVEQAENEEIQELDTVAQISELEGTLTTVSKYFYFDSQLEEIAKKQYTDYQDMINDYKNYTNFLVYRQYYNKLISNISVYMENDTIKGNLNFVQVEDEIRSEDWYERVSEEKSGIVWAYLPHKIDGYDHTLALCRMIKTKKSENVGALVIYIRPERFEEYIRDRAGDTFLVLNGGQLISSKRDNLNFKKIKEEMPDKTEEKWQKQITIDGEEYIMTCETIQQKNSTDYLQVVGVRAYRDILKNANASNIMRQGIKIAIAGCPNAGKSSLFNALLNHERAIVTEIPGTTRDVIQESIDIDGIPATLIDTAGIRDNDEVDKVEAIGIEYTKNCVENADLILFLFDWSKGFDENDALIYEMIENKPHIKIAAKSDLAEVPNPEALNISSKTGYNIEELKEKIKEAVLDKDAMETEFVTNQRQEECLKNAKNALTNALIASQNNELQDLISIDIKSALLSLDEITGEVITDEILENIFEHFCIGK